jgi:uncharacterized protein (DUF427 family)
MMLKQQAILFRASHHSGPLEEISVDRNPSRVIVSVAGHVIADTR